MKTHRNTKKQRKSRWGCGEFALTLILILCTLSTASAQLVDLAIDLDLNQPGIQDSVEVEFGKRATGAVILTGFAQDLEAYTIIVGASPPGSMICAETEARQWICDAVYGADASNPGNDLVGRIYEPLSPPCLVQPPVDPLELFIFEVCPVEFPLQLRFLAYLSGLVFSEETLGQVLLTDARARIHSATFSGVLPTPTSTKTSTPQPPPTPTRIPTASPTATLTIKPTPFPADLNGDGRVDSLDLYLFIEQWQKRFLPAKGQK
jgi:hypothetical protein